MSAPRVSLGLPRYAAQRVVRVGARQDEKTVCKMRGDLNCAADKL